jgi:hypothetical protein
MMLVASSALILAVRYCIVVSFVLRLLTGGSYCVDLNMIVKILSFDSQEQRPEPLKRAEISANPEKVHFSEASAALRVVHPVPDTLEDRSERCHTDTGTDQYSDFELEHIFRGRTERTVDVNSRENLAKCDLCGSVLFTLRAALFKAASECLSERLRKVADHTNVDGDVVLLRRASERKGMVLPD